MVMVRIAEELSRETTKTSRKYHVEHRGLSIFPPSCRIMSYSSVTRVLSGLQMVSTSFYEIDQVTDWA